MYNQNPSFPGGYPPNQGYPPQQPNNYPPSQAQLGGYQVQQPGSQPMPQNQPIGFAPPMPDPYSVMPQQPTNVGFGNVSDPNWSQQTAYPQSQNFYPQSGAPMGTYPGSLPPQGSTFSNQPAGFSCPGNPTNMFQANVGPQPPYNIQSATPTSYGQGAPAMAYSNQPNSGYMASASLSTSHDRGTILPISNFNAETDAMIIRKAMKGAGTDEKAIINVLAKRTNEQRQMIRTTFKTLVGKDILKELHSELSGKFRDIVLHSLKPAAEYDAWSMYEAMQGLGTKESVLTEILATRTNSQIQALKKSYKELYNKDLESRVKSETSGFYGRVLVSLLQGNRNELTPDQVRILETQGPNGIVDQALAQREAQELYNAGEKKFGTDEACFIRILAIRNVYQLRSTFEQYKAIAGRDIISSIEREMSGDLCSSLKAIAQCMINRAAYFANRLDKAMRGAGTSDATLIRILLSRSEIDMQNIKEEFQKTHSASLAQWIKDDTSGDYRRFILTLIGEEH